MSKKQTLKPLVRTLRPIMETFVPSIKELDQEGLHRVLDRIDEKLLEQPQALRRQLKIFVRALNLLPIPLYGKPFKRLLPEKQTLFLEKIQYSPVKILRVGLWGLRTLVYLGYYGDPEIQGQLGYNPDISGWEATKYAHN